MFHLSIYSRLAIMDLVPFGMMQYQRMGKNVSKQGTKLQRGVDITNCMTKDE